MLGVIKLSISCLYFNRIRFYFYDNPLWLVFITETCSLKTKSLFSSTLFSVSDRNCNCFEMYMKNNGLYCILSVQTNIHKCMLIHYLSAEKQNVCICIPIHTYICIFFWWKLILTLKNQSIDQKYQQISGDVLILIND